MTPGRTKVTLDLPTILLRAAKRVGIDLETLVLSELRCRVGDNYACDMAVVHPKLPDWEFYSYDDGTQQWVRNDRLYVERELFPPSGKDAVREFWHIVDRNAPTVRDTDLPPIIAGPFENIKIAMIAAELLTDDKERT